LLEKYRLKDNEARSFASFISKMIQWKPKDRASARELLDHPWLKERDDYDVWMSKNHLNEFRLVNIQKFPEYKKKLDNEKLEE
jgi:serine/threonine protein kinase